MGKGWAIGVAAGEVGEQELRACCVRACVCVYVCV